MLATILTTNKDTAQIFFILALFAGVIFTAVETFAFHRAIACLGLAVTFIAAGLIFLV